MEGSTDEARVASSAQPAASAEESPAGAEAEEPKKGGRFARKKDKKKAAKKAKKSTNKHSKDKEETAATPADADASPSLRRSGATVQGAQGRVRSGGVRGAEGDGAPSGDHQNEPSTSAASAREVHGAAAPDTRRDSGIEDESYRQSTAYDSASASAAAARGGRHPDYDDSVTLRSHPARSRDAQGQDDESADPRRSKSRSRSGSRKRLSSLFRRRGRSGGRSDDRTKSETDIPGVGGGAGGGAGGGEEGGGTTEGPGQDRTSQEMKARKANSLDRAKGRHAAFADRGGNPALHTGSLERDAYRRYDPTKQPRDWWQHMTVKDLSLIHI